MSEFPRFDAPAYCGACCGLTPFGGRTLVCDPWLAPGLLREQGCEHASLGESEVIFIPAGVVSEHRGLLGRPEGPGKRRHIFSSRVQLGYGEDRVRRDPLGRIVIWT